MPYSFSVAQPNRIIRVLLVQCPEKHMSSIRYVFEELMVRIGFPISLSVSSNGERFDLQYGSTIELPNVPFIRFDVSCYDPTTKFVSSGEPPIWHASGTHSLDEIDLIGGMFRLLAMLDESQISDDQRDRKGIFLTNSLPIDRKKVCDRVLVENHANAIKKLIGFQKDELPPFPIWPNGAKWSLLLTHDTDAVRASAWPELVFNASKTLIRRDRVRFNLLKRGLRDRKIPFNNDALNGFEKWRAVTSDRGIRSAFFLFVRSKVKADLNDCRSSVADPKMNWDPLIRMLDEGWEFGYHPSIKAKMDIDEFIESKFFIESKLDAPIYGLRHHYWALDWKNPYLTYRMHVNAGFRYDLSNAWRDTFGFRSGTCLPFRPWDPIRQRGLDMYVLPTSLMDGHIIGETGYDGSGLFRAAPVLTEVESVSGMAVLDWHTESSLNILCYDGHLDLACEILDYAINRSEIWITTPWEMVTWWHTRRKSLMKNSQLLR